MKRAGNLKPECDVFGRTCFYATMKNLTESPTEFCPQCKEACDFTLFKKTVVKDVEFIPEGVNDLNEAMYNITTQDPELINFLKAFDSKIGNMDDHKHIYATMSMIIVHLRFLPPEIDYVDVTYSIWDKFANFGGNFGIFAEITGASFLGMLNLFILIMKLISYITFSTCKEKCKKSKVAKKK